jgi:hypothetical protein
MHEVSVFYRRDDNQEWDLPNINVTIFGVLNRPS